MNREEMTKAMRGELPETEAIKKVRIATNQIENSNRKEMEGYMIVSKEMKLRLFRAGAMMKNIPTEDYEKIIEYHRLSDYEGRTTPRMRDRYDLLVNEGMSQVRRFIIHKGLPGKDQPKTQRLPDECIENALSQLEQMLLQNPPTPRERCCTCGSLLPKVSGQEG